MLPERVESRHNRDIADVQPIVQLAAAAVFPVADAQDIDACLLTNMTQDAVRAFFENMVGAIE